MKTINYLSNNINKIGDTSSVVLFQLKKDGIVEKFSDLVAKVNIADMRGNFLFSVNSVIDKSNVESLSFNQEPLSRLTEDSYLMEVEVPLLDGTISKYPSDGYGTITVTKSLNNREGDLIPLITFENTLQAVEDKVNTYLQTVAKGVQGERGEQGYSGLVSNKAQFTDYNDVAQHMDTYAGNWFTDNTTIANAPEDMAYSNIQIISGNAPTIGRIVIHNQFNNHFWLGSVFDGKIQSWAQINNQFEQGNGAVKDNEVNYDATILEIETDKAIYKPSDVVNFSVSVKGNKGKLKVTYYNRGNIVTTTFVAYETNVAQWSWRLPDGDKEQYLIKVENITNKHDETDYIGINVASNNKYFPIMGFLGDYNNFNPLEQKKIMDNLKRHHINYVQYYDYFHDHDRPVWVGDHGEVAEFWDDLARRHSRRDVIQEYISLGKKYGMLNMAYGLINGVSFNEEKDGFTKEMFLFNHAGGNMADIAVNPLKPWGRYDIYLANFLKNSYKTLAFSRMDDVFGALGFDGWHIDTLGAPGDKYEANGNIIKNDYFSSVGYPSFINDARNHFGNKRMSFNAVGMFGQENVVKTDVDFIYSELWPQTGTPTYKDLVHDAIMQLQYDDEKSLIIPAYMNKEHDWANDSDKSFNTPSVVIIDNLIMATGATHLELGEHMLCSEYFPNHTAYMKDDLKEYIRKQYDFMVAYHKMLDIRNFTDNTTIQNYDVAKNDFDSNKLTVIEKTSDSFCVASIVNTKGLNGNDWRDDDKKRQYAEPVRNVKFGFGSIPVRQAYYATVEDPEPKKVTLDSTGSFVIDTVDKYVLVWCEKY